ncbi:MAG: hypothetical protein J7K31_02500 [Candidatus Aenigmarchaeota archaeon]|nr:hypothetical protein [Candidatus Aenigmarchaeota archaeon]
MKKKSSRIGMKTRLLVIVIVFLLILAVLLLGFSLRGFDIPAAEKVGNNYAMGIGEEATILFNANPVGQVFLVLPKGIRVLEKNKNGIHVMAVKVGKWPIKTITGSVIAYICIETEKSEAINNCKKL